MKRSSSGMVAAMRAALLIVVTLVSTPARGGASPAPAPIEIVHRAILRWEGRPRPARMTYTVAFTGWHKGAPYRRTMRVDYSAATHETSSVTLDAQGSAPPFVAPEKQRFVPTDTFGFVPADGESAAAPPPADQPALPVIATVRAQTRYPYEVRFIDVEPAGERSAYHLALAPRRNDDKLPLRELWIDTETYDVVRAVALQFETLGPLRVPYRLSVWYAQEGPYWLIDRLASGGSIRAGVFSYETRAEAVFEDFAFPS